MDDKLGQSTNVYRVWINSMHDFLIERFRFEHCSHSARHAIQTDFASGVVDLSTVHGVRHETPHCLYELFERFEEHFAHSPVPLSSTATLLLLVCTVLQFHPLGVIVCSSIVMDSLEIGERSHEGFQILHGECWELLGCRICAGRRFHTCGRCHRTA